MTKWDRIQHKIVSQEEATTVVQSWKDNEEIVVFTNGCFDILHRGHVSYLAKAASLGEYLVVGLNSDSSVKRQNKGNDRPINDQESRALVLASLEFVNMVIYFENDTPEELIHLLSPSILVKGADYNAEETDPTQKGYIVGSDFVKSEGGTVKTIALEEGFSTSQIINKIRSSH